MAGNCELATELQNKKNYVGDTDSTTAMTSFLGLLIYQCIDLGLHSQNVIVETLVFTLVTGFCGDLLTPRSPIRLIICQLWRPDETRISTMTLCLYGYLVWET